MATEVLMPKLGATMERGTIIKWCVEEGEPVQAGAPLLEIMTDKINIDVEAPVSGILLKTYHGADEEVPVQQLIGYIGERHEQVPRHQTEAPSSPTEKNKSSWPFSVGGADKQSNKIPTTPASRRLARLHQIDLSEVKGSGPNGRIQRLDLENFIKEKRGIDAAPIKTQEEQVTQNEVIEKKESNRQELVKVEGIRKVVAQRMVQSAFTAPHVTLVSEADLTKTLELKVQLTQNIEKQTGCRLSITEILVKLAAHTLQKHPMVNASLQGDHIVLNHEVNIGIAVAVSNGLVVPVVRKASQKGFTAIVEECKQLATLARDGRLSPDQMSGGTFTISNLGMYAVDAFTPIVNPPESAILGVGRIQEKPIGVNGSIELKPMVTLSLSFDHRVIDGAPAAAFLTDLKGVLENPYRMLE